MTTRAARIPVKLFGDAEPNGVYIPHCMGLLRKEIIEEYKIIKRNGRFYLFDEISHGTAIYREVKQHYTITEW